MADVLLRQEPAAPAGEKSRARPAASRPLFLLGLATACWAFSFGVEAPVISIWLRDTGHGSTVIGLNSAVYYVGIALAAGLVPWLMRRTGRFCIVGGMIASGLTIALFPYCGGLAGAFVLRLLNGVAGAISLIPLETTLGIHSPPEQRARSFGFYAACVGFGMAIGTMVGLQVYAQAPWLAFVVGGIGAAIAGVLFLRWPVADPIDESACVTGSVHFGKNVLSFGSAWSQGILESSMVSLVPVFLLGVGFNESGTSWMMGAVLLGIIAAQVPLGWLADRFGRTAVLVGCYFAALLALAVLPFCSAAVTLGFWLWIVASCGGAFYPLGLALLSERVPVAGLPRANACFLTMNCIGSLAGPALSGVAMDHLGGAALFSVTGLATGLALAAWAISLLLERLSRTARVRRLV